MKSLCFMFSVSLALVCLVGQGCKSKESTPSVAKELGSKPDDNSKNLIAAASSGDNAGSSATKTLATKKSAETQVVSPEEQAMAKEFIEKFFAAIDAKSTVGWVDLHAANRREKLPGVIDRSYKAWTRGTAPIMKELRATPLVILKTQEKIQIRFDGVFLPNQPEQVYLMTVVIEDGKMLLDEL